MPDKPIHGTRVSHLIGLGLIVVGLLLFGVQRIQVMRAETLWPFFVILPGAVILIAAVVSDVGGQKAAGFGATVTSVGLLLLYQNTFGHFESWAYGWALVFPTAVGLGSLLYGSAHGNEELVRQGRTYAIVGLCMFLVGFVFFEFFVGISGKAVFAGFRRSWIGPFVLVAVGIALLLRNGSSRE